MTAVARELLTDLRRRGVKLLARGDRLRVSAPQGIGSEGLRAQLVTHKSALVDHLHLEAEVLRLSLDEFERQDRAIECTVPWLKDSIWLVPTLPHVEELVRRGVARGRIWAPGELRDLMSAPGLHGRDAQLVGKLRATFDAELISIEEDPRVATVTSPTCPACRETRLWRSTRGAIVCGVCHPPAAPALVAEWLAEET